MLTCLVNIDVDQVAAQAKEEELKEISAEFKRLEEVKVIVQGVKVDLANNVEKVSKVSCYSMKKNTITRLTSHSFSFIRW